MSGRREGDVCLGASYTSAGERSSGYDRDAEETVAELFSAMGGPLGTIYGLPLEELVPVVNGLIRHARYLAEKEGKTLRLTEEEEP